MKPVARPGVVPERTGADKTMAAISLGQRTKR